MSNWKDKAQDIFNHYRGQQQNAQYEERLKRLARRLESPNIVNNFKCNGKENRIEQAENKINEMLIHLDEYWYTTEKKMSSLAEQLSKAEHHIDRQKYEKQSVDPATQEIKKKHHSHIENQANLRRTFENQILSSLENELTQMRMSIQEQQLRRTMATEMLQKSNACGQIFKVRQLIEQLTRARQVADKDTLEQISQECGECDILLEQLQQPSDQDNYGLLRQVAGKVAAELEMHTMQRKRTEQQILTLLEGMCDKLPTE